MTEINTRSFGLVVAYLVPGFVVLWGASYHCETVRAWLAVSPQNAPTVGDLLYATLGSIAAGMIASAFRWAVFDTLHHRTGIPPPAWVFSTLHQKLEAFHTLVEIHYRYYQFYANMVVALTFAYVAHRTTLVQPVYRVGVLDLGFIVVGIVLFLSSRDALRKYYLRGSQLLGTKD